MRRLLPLLSAALLVPLILGIDPGAQPRAQFASCIGTAQLTWFNPSAYEDGTPLSGLSFIHVERSLNSVVGPFDRIESLGLAILLNQTHTDTGLCNGDWSYRVVATDSAFGVESDPSNIASKLIALGGTNDAPKTEAPTGLTVL